MKYLVLLLLLGVAACAQSDLSMPMDDMPVDDMPMGDRMPMDNMPCHQMPDGEWMGDCDDQAEVQTDFSISGSSQEAQEMRILDVTDGESITIEASIVEKTVAGRTFSMYAYNGQIPGVAIRAEKDAEITVDFVNNIDQETTIHWHGLRHDVEDDGVPGVSQDPVKPGETFTYTVRFPDTGVFWYHPHVREDSQQEGGLSGLMLVEESDYWPEVDREELLVLDDLLLDDDGLVPFGAEHATHALMGRYGNTMFINGNEEYNLDVTQGEIVRFYVANVANARPFALKFEGAKMRLVGADLGAYEESEFVDEVIISPAERYVVDVLFNEPGSHKILNENEARTWELGNVDVAPGTPGTLEPTTNAEVTSDIASFQDYFNKEADYELELDFRMKHMDETMAEHMQMMKAEMHDEGIEWEDTMPMMNQQMTTEDLEWIIRDANTGAENMNITMDAEVGDVVKIKITNLESSAHPMQHPIHLHGQRFLVLTKDGEVQDNLAWEDTALIPVGQEVELLVDVTNPGEWMMHCHIAEHLEAGMMASFVVNE